MRSSKPEPCPASITDFTPSFSTQTLWAFLTDCTQVLLHPPSPKHPDCMCSPLSPPAAVCLKHDPTIIRQSPAGPSLARGDTHEATKYIIFKDIFVNGGRVSPTLYPYLTEKCDMSYIYIYGKHSPEDLIQETGPCICLVLSDSTYCI